MATLTDGLAHYLDEGTARTAGETWSIQNGSSLTIRTDSRFHANSPASMTGSLGSQTIVEGEIIYNATAVRWLPFNTGSGNVPAIGTSITQVGVTSSYILGVYASLTSAPSTPGTAMPSSGFIKFREVTGSFTTGALTGIGANALSADLTGWIEIVADDASTITIPRLGKHTIRGDWFYLEETNGSLGQTIQIPTNGGGAGTYCPGVWVETSPGSEVYEYWPALNGSANGWARQHLGAAEGETDRRQNFVKDVGSGQIQFGESSSLSATYANIAAQASTYASISHSCTYTWSDNKVTVYYGTGHLLKTGHQVGLDFTSGGATAYDGIYTITVIDAYYYTVDLTGSGASGNVTARPGVTITFTAHTLGVGDIVYCDFTSGTGVDGDYEIYGVTSANAYLIKYAHTTVLTSGNVSVHSRYEITFTAHSLAIGNRVYLDFTSGAGVDGIYTIVEVPTANTFRVIANNNGSADSGNVSVKQTIGNIPPSGCKIRIPNVILRGCATGTRASNSVNATITNRPEWTTTTAGAIDIEYAYSAWYMNFSQPYSVKLYNSSTFDSIQLTECATALDVDNLHTSMNAGLDARALQCSYNFAGGTIKNCKFHRGNTPNSSDHALEVSYCAGLSLENTEAGIIQYARSSGSGIALSYCSNISLVNCREINSSLPLTAVLGCSITNHGHIDRFIGYTNATTPYYSIAVGAGCKDITVNGVTSGYNGTVINVHPYSGIVNITATGNGIVKNIGSVSSPFPMGTWRQNLYSSGYAYATSGSNNIIQVKRIYIDNNARTGPFNYVNSDKNVIIEHIKGGDYTYSAMAVFALADAGLYSRLRAIRTGNISMTGQASVYGTHFKDMFYGDTWGVLALAMNEPLPETINQFTMVNGVAKFDSSGGIFMKTIGDQAIWEDDVFRLGHTSFQNVTPYMAGGTIGNYTIEYQVDNGSGYGETWKTLNGTNLSGEVIDPAVGFKIKIRITTTSTNTTAITYIRLYTNSSAAAQLNLYPLETKDATYALSGLAVGTEVVLLDSFHNILKREVLTGTTFEYDYQWNSDDGNSTGNYALIWKNDKIPFKLSNITLDGEDISIPLSQTDDLVYQSSITPYVAIDYANSLIILNSGERTFNVSEVYSIWKDNILLSNNAQYDFAFSEVGGNTISGVKSIPFYVFLENGWKVRPDEANHTLLISGGVLVDAAGGDPFVNTLGAYTVRINYEQPVQAIAVSTSGGSLTAADVWNYITRTLTDKTGFFISGTKQTLDALNDISEAEVNTQVDAALNDYDPPTRAELTLDKNEIISDIGDIPATPSGDDIADEIMTRGLATEANAAINRAGIEAVISALHNISSSEVREQVDASLVAYDAPTRAELTADKADIINEVQGVAIPPSVEEIRQEIDSNSVKINELHKLQGLNTDHPMTITEHSRTVDDIVLAISGDGKTESIVTRQ